jgi:methionyl-tRNA formyltransferase
MNNDGLNIVLITQGISRVVKPLFESRHNLIGIIEDAPRDQRKPDFLKRKLLEIIHIFKASNNLNDFCKKHNLAYFYLNKETKNKVIEWLEVIKPDIIVVFSMSHLLSEDIFNWPKYKTINLHTAYLPEFRGPNPDFWHYYYQVTNPGITVHYIDKGEDTGDIIFQERYRLELGIKSSQRSDKLVGEVGVRLLLKTLDAIQNGDAPRIKQPVISPTTRARNLKPEEHSSVVNWKEWKIDRIWNLLRGTESWLNALPPPKGLFVGQRWIIEEMILKDDIPNELFGKIRKENGKYFVYCKGGKIHLSVKLKLKPLIKRLLGIG